MQLAERYLMDAVPRKDTIAFISTYDHPSRDSIEQTIRDAFPTYRFQSISVVDLVKVNRRWRLPNLYYLASEYGAKITLRNATIRDSYYRTSYLYHRVRNTMADIINSRRHVFSFQVQSLFDTSVPDVPHFVYTDHTHLSNLGYSFFDPRKLRPRRWLRLENMIYQNAARIFTRSHNITADLMEHYAVSPEKIACVYAGANVPVESNYQVANNNYANKRILFIGNDWVRKGGPILAAAFKEVLRIHPGAHLTIVGANPDVNVPNCTVLGQLSLAELSALFAQSSIFCLPTRVEPFGVAILDAMVHRLPVVATSVGAIPDMIQEGVCGHLVTPGDAQQLARTLIDLIGDPGRCRRFGEAGFRLANARYRWPLVGARFRSEILSFFANSAPTLLPAAAFSTEAAISHSVLNKTR
jgi:glycosyltransferase involved in cell wall biosynthesis